MKTPTQLLGSSSQEYDIVRSSPITPPQAAQALAVAEALDIPAGPEMNSFMKGVDSGFSHPHQVRYTMTVRKEAWAFTLGEVVGASLYFRRDL